MINKQLSLIEVIGRAMAEMDGCSDVWDSERSASTKDIIEGRYLGYNAEAERIVARIKQNGFIAMQGWIPVADMPESWKDGYEIDCAARDGCGGHIKVCNVGWDEIDNHWYTNEGDRVFMDMTDFVMLSIETPAIRKGGNNA